MMKRILFKVVRHIFRALLAIETKEALDGIERFMEGHESELV